MKRSLRTNTSIKESVPLPTKSRITLKVNGAVKQIEVAPWTTLLDALREQFDLTGTKKGCDHGQCGACTVLVNGKRINSCMTLAIMQDGVEVTTIEGLAEGDALHPVQEAFIEHDAFQCGFCTSGQMMAAKALLDKNSKPTIDEVRAGLAGNLCRCGAFPKIIESVLAAAGKA